MNFSRTLSIAVVAGALSQFALPAITGFGQTTATTDPVGYTALPLLANSDSLISIPFTRPVAYAGAIGSISGSTITLATSPGFTASQFVYASGTQSNTYYAIIGPNVATVSGTVTATNGSTAITATAGLSSLVAGDEIIVNGLAYNVASVTSDTAAVLSRAYTGTTGSGLTATYDHSPKEGSHYTVTANDTGSVTVNLNGDSLSTVTAGTSVSVIPYWTLGTAFPSTDAGTSYIASTGTTNRTRGTTLMMPDLTSAGFNLGTSASYTYYNSAWRLVVSTGLDTTDSYNDTILPPTTYFTVRNGSTATTFTPTGGVYMNRLTVPLDTQASTAQDNAVAVPRPTATTLNDLDLISSGAFTASTGTTNRTRGDTLITYDNTQAAFNKAASASYVYLTGAWRLVTSTGVDTSTDYGTTALSYGTGFTIRKIAVTGGVTSFWQNTRNY